MTINQVTLNEGKTSNSHSLVLSKNNLISDQQKIIDMNKSTLSSNNPNYITTFDSTIGKPVMIRQIAVA